MAAAAEPSERFDLGGGTVLEVVLMPAGKFTQGSPQDEPGRGVDEDQRQVEITREFLIGRTAVTRGQWERFVMETGYRSEAETGTSGGYGWDGKGLVQRKTFNWRSPGFSQTAEHPVCLVTLPDAQAFCTWLGRKVRRHVTLPSEAQWEYACRAGTLTAWHSGAEADGAWHKANAGDGTRAVDSMPGNPWGLSIGGNVSEWCLDWYAPYSPGPVENPLQENANLSDKPRRVLRGGSWLRDAKNTRSASRFRSDPRSRNADIGFRIVCPVEENSVDMPAVPAREVRTDPPKPPTAPAKRVMPPADHGGGEQGRRFSPGTSVFAGLVCLLIPLGILVLLVRSITRRAQTSSNPFVSPPPPPVPRGTIRKVDDGFWINGPWHPGTLLHVRYVTDGVAHAQDVTYLPGPEGQFIYTGSAPQSVSVVAAGNDHDIGVPPVGTIHPVFDDEPSATFPRPPRFPSAY